MPPLYYTRPVPLEHYIFPAGGEGLHLVVDNKGRFRENNFQVTAVLQVVASFTSWRSIICMQAC